VNVEAANEFWERLVQSVSAIVGGGTGAASAGRAASSSVVPYPETGLLTVYATARQHEIVQNLIDSAVESAQRQVLIQATIAEVTLNDNFQAGIDWSFLTQAGRAGFSLSSALLPASGSLGEFSQFVLEYQDPDTEGGKIIDAQVRLLEEFGDVSILSSPQIMTLNNQTAILKVVDDIVYFEVDAETSQSQTSIFTTFETQPKTVSVGVTMAVTPQINPNDSIILNVRPSISRVIRFVQDPNPQLPVNPGVPELRVREMESILRLNSGQVAVLGGLMENNNQVDRANTPILSKIPGLGELFKSRSQQHRKTELVIFLRPLVIRNPGLDGDLRQYRTFLERQK
jgi:general secretion pathway protein D